MLSGPRLRSSRLLDSRGLKGRHQPFLLLGRRSQGRPARFRPQKMPIALKAAIPVQAETRGQRPVRAWFLRCLTHRALPLLALFQDVHTVRVKCVVHCSSVPNFCRNRGWRLRQLRAGTTPISLQAQSLHQKRPSTLPNLLLLSYSAGRVRNL